MPKSIDISLYQPEIVRDYREFRFIAETENPELIHVWDALDGIFFDQFIETLTNNGCKRWEQILAIAVSAADTLEERRARIKARINETLPYTYRMLQQILNSICGEDGYTMKLLHEKYTLLVRIELGKKKRYAYIKETLDRILPANLLLDISIHYNEHKKVARYRNSLLSKYTHREIREEELPAFAEHRECQAYWHKELGNRSHWQTREGRK